MDAHLAVTADRQENILCVLQKKKQTRGRNLSGERQHQRAWGSLGALQQNPGTILCFPTEVTPESWDRAPKSHLAPEEGQ